MSDDKKEHFIEASRQARRTGTVYLTFVAYSALTILGASDRQIVLNDIVRLPIFNAEIPLNSYFILSPLVIIAIFCYFHLQLRVARSAIPKVDSGSSAPLSENYPWMVYCTDNPESGVIGWIPLSAFLSRPILSTLIYHGLSVQSL